MELFENETNTYEGITRCGLDKDIKNTTDYTIYDYDEKWKNIYDLLTLELKNNIKLYINKLGMDSFDEKYIYFDNKQLVTENFLIQRYIKNYGKYIYHNDFHIKNSGFRVITFLWYLNTIEEGGETEFWGNYKIKPEQGKLIFFPALWCFPHCGNIPLSDNKYIITGWLYEMESSFVQIQDKSTGRYNYNTFFSETECEWIIFEIDNYYKNNNDIKLNHISFELITSIHNFLLIKIKDLLNKIKKFYNLSDTSNFIITKLVFVTNICNDDNEKQKLLIPSNNSIFSSGLDHYSSKLPNTDLNIAPQIGGDSTNRQYNFYIPLCENIEFYMNDNTTINILFGNLFLFLISLKTNNIIFIKLYLYNSLNIFIKDGGNLESFAKMSDSFLII
jgi:hypothetical protein